MVFSSIFNFIKETRIYRKLQRLLKFYKYLCGIFCKCYRRPQEPGLALIWINIYLLEPLYKVYYHYPLNDVRKLSLMDELNFDQYCYNNKVVAESWNYYTMIKSAHKDQLERYNLNQTRANAQFLSTFLPNFSCINDKFLVLNQHYYGCAKDKYEEEMKVKFWDLMLLQIVLSVIIRMSTKTFITSIFQPLLSRKRYFRIKIVFAVVDLLFFSIVFYVCKFSYDGMLLKAEEDIENYFFV